MILSGSFGREFNFLRKSLVSLIYDLIACEIVIQKIRNIFSKIATVPYPRCTRDIIYAAFYGS